MSRFVFPGARVLITGASSGIGAALARRLSRQGCRLLLTARREERLAALARELEEDGGDVTTVAGDISMSLLRSQLIARMEHDWGGLDLLVNNAGIGSIGEFSVSTDEEWRRLFEVNLFAAVFLTRDCLSGLRRGRGAMVVNLGSVLGHRAAPFKVAYSATKFALHGFSDGLRAELVDEGIRVLHVCPSTTRSEFFDHLEVPRPNGRHSDRGMTPDYVAARIVAAVSRGRSELVLPWSGALVVWLDRLCPRLADRLVAGYGRRERRRCTPHPDPPDTGK